MSDVLDIFEMFFGKKQFYSHQMDELMSLLDEACIKYTVRRGILGGDMLDVYNGIDGDEKILNVISDGYGRERGLLEAQGLGWDSVGDLLATEIFFRILEYLDKNGPDGQIRYKLRKKRGDRLEQGGEQNDGK